MRWWNSLKKASPDSALMYLKEIHQANLALGDASKIFKSCRAAGYLCEMNNRLDEAKSFYAEAMGVAEKSLSNEDRWNIYTDLGNFA